MRQMLFAVFLATNLAVASESVEKPIGETALLSLDGYYACLDVQLRGGKSYPFILDTGAGSTLLLNSFAEAQGFRVFTKAIAGTAGKVTRSAIYDLGEISVGGARWPHVFGIGIAVKRLPCAPGIDAVGALGMDFLSQPVLELDFPSRRVRIYQPKRFRYLGSGAEIKLQPFGRSPLVPVQVQTSDGIKHAMRLIFDTGAPSTDASLSWTAGRDMGLPNLRHIKGYSGGANGERYPATRSRVHSLAIGSDKTIRVANALISVNHANRGLFARREGQSGLLGLNWAKQRRIWLDMPRMRIIVESGAEPSNEALRPASAVQINSFMDYDANGKLRVAKCFVDQSEPECDPELFVGDEIVSINGRPAPPPVASDQKNPKATPAQLAFWQPVFERKPLQIQVQRDNKVLEVHVEPRELLPF